MKTVCRIVFGVWVAVIANSVLLAKPAAKISNEQSAAVDNLVQKEMKAQGIPGLSIAVAVGDELVFEKGFGFSDVENKVPATPDTEFRTASIAKTFTAVSVMQLAEQGKIDLDRPVDEYYPAFPKKQWPITARLLLSHMAGVRHYARPFENLNTKHYADVASALHTFDRDPLLFKPGTDFHYSTFGFNLLGAIVEKASGEEFAAYLQEAICTPAGLHSTRADNHYAIIPNRTRGYMRFDASGDDRLPSADSQGMKTGELYNAPLHDTSVKIPGGGLVSTSSDLVRFATAVNRGKLLKPESLKAMWEPQHTSSGKASEYGLGWRILEHDGEKVVGHGGGQAGTTTLYLLCPERHIAAAVMCNLQNAKLQPLCLKLLDQAASAGGAQQNKSGK